MERDTKIFDLIQQERNRQTKGIELIASENFVSDQVMEAMGSVMTNKNLKRNIFKAKMVTLSKLANTKIN